MIQIYTITAVRTYFLFDLINSPLTWFSMLRRRGCTPLAGTGWRGRSVWILGVVGVAPAAAAPAAAPGVSTRGGPEVLVIRVTRVVRRRRPVEVFVAGRHSRRVATCTQSRMYRRRVSAAEVQRLAVRPQVLHFTNRLGRRRDLGARKEDLNKSCSPAYVYVSSPAVWCAAFVSVR